MTQIKICGITSLEDALHAAACGADALGFIFYPPSPRYISPTEAREIIARLPPYLCRVGVFVNEEEEAVRKTAADCGLDMIQLHGDETPEYCTGLGDKEMLIKALTPATEEDLRQAARYPTAAILVDARTEGLYGGTGRRSSWALAAKMRDNMKIVLAGGLDCGNIRAALRQVRPGAVDINSGVEKSPGKKDPEKVAEIIRIIREEEKREAVKREEVVFRLPACRRHSDQRRGYPKQRGMAPGEIKLYICKRDI